MAKPKATPNKRNFARSVRRGSANSPKTAVRCAGVRENSNAITGLLMGVSDMGWAMLLGIRMPSACDTASAAKPQTLQARQLPQPARSTPVRLPGDVP